MYEWGYARVLALNATHLGWHWIKAETGEVLDRMVIVQSDPTQPWDADSQAAEYAHYNVHKNLRRNS